MDAADFYTGIVVEGYALLKSTEFPAQRYVDFIAASGEPALELGCGDGDPLLELRRRGIEVEGVDSSADMLARCARRAASAGIKVVTHHQRMEDLALGRRFATIFLAGPTFNLLPDDELALRTLVRIREHLTPNGSVLVPLWIPPQTPREEFGVVRRAEADDGSSVAFRALSEDYDPTQRTRMTHTRYERDSRDGQQSADRAWVIHWHTQESFRALADTAGLRVLAMADLQGVPVTGDEEQFLVTLAR